MVEKFKLFGENVQSYFFNVLNNDPLPMRSNYSNELKHLIFKMLEKRPERRITIFQIESLPFIQFIIQANPSLYPNQLYSCQPNSQQHNQFLVNPQQFNSFISQQSHSSNHQIQFHSSAN
jgi:serine/threonine protein kinase